MSTIHELTTGLFPSLQENLNANSSSRNRDGPEEGQGDDLLQDGGDAPRPLELVSSGNPLQQFRLQQLRIGMRSVEIAASRTQMSGGVIRTARILAQRAVVDIRISSVILERYAEQVSELQDVDPELLQEYLALIELLDENTPEEFDSFFARVRAILQGDTDLEIPQREGAVIDVNVPVQEDEGASDQARAFFMHVRVSVTSVHVTVTNRQVNKSDPLVLDLDGDGVEVTSAEKGRMFDINGDGRTDRTAFVTGGDAFLALDRNGNGSIDDGTELFGEHHGAPDGFAELSRFDDNGDLVIDTSDSVFSKLFLFDGGSLRRLADAGILSISTVMDSENTEEINGNETVGSSSFLWEGGSSGAVSDLLLSYIA